VSQFFDFGSFGGWDVLAADAIAVGFHSDEQLMGMALRGDDAIDPHRARRSVRSTTRGEGERADDGQQDADGGGA
jgi:hypothetical protein